MGSAGPRKIPLAIPRIVFQTWKTHEVPAHWVPSVTGVRKHLPGWRHDLFDDAENSAFIAQHFPEYLGVYESFPYPIQRADFVRYAKLYVDGGLYLDLDIEILAPLDHLFAPGSGPPVYLVETKSRAGYLTNALMASAPRQPFWLDCLREAALPPPWYAVERHLHVLETTGPGMLTRVARRWGSTAYTLLPSTVCPYSMCETTYTSPGALTRPLGGSSWVSPLALAYKQCYCNSEYIFGLVAVVVLILLTIVALFARGPYFPGYPAHSGPRHSRTPANN